MKVVMIGMNLTPYVPYFKAMRNQKVDWTLTNSEDGILQMGYPKYDEILLAFIREFRASDDFDARYQKTLKAAQIKIKLNQKIIDQVLATQDPIIIKAMLSAIIGAEEVDEGSWAKALQEGFLYQLATALVDDSDEG